MAKIDFDFDFSKNWKDVTDFPTKEYSEKRVREDIQCLFDELKAHCNHELHPSINELYSRVAALGGGGQVEHNVMADDSIDSNNIVDNAVTKDKIADGSITTEKLDSSVVYFIVNKAMEELMGMSSNMTLLATDSLELYDPAYVSAIPGEDSEKYVSYSYSTLGLDPTIPMSRIAVHVWATPHGSTITHSPSILKDYRYAYGSGYPDGSEEKQLDIYLANTYEREEEIIPGSSTPSPPYIIVVHYAIYLIEE